MPAPRLMCGAPPVREVSRTSSPPGCVHLTSGGRGVPLGEYRVPFICSPLTHYMGASTLSEYQMLWMSPPKDVRGRCVEGA